MLAQIPGTRGVVPFFLRLAVLTAVELDNQALLDAAEVRKVRTKWVVATKLEAVEALGSQMSPQFSFLVGRVARSRRPRSRELSTAETISARLGRRAD